MVPYSVYLEEKHVDRLFKPYIKTFIKNVKGAKKLIDSLNYYESYLPTTQENEIKSEIKERIDEGK
jgi:hypothetical protein